MDEEKRYRERRKRQRKKIEKLGRVPCCPICGEDDPRCFEKDHIAGQKHSDETETRCKNCHAKRTDMQQNEHPQSTADPRSELEVIARTTLGHMDYLELIIERQRRFAETLIKMAETQSGADNEG